MSSISFQISVLLVLIIANGLFSLSKMAIVSARKVRLQQLANQGDVQARVALELAESPNHFLSTIQIAITLLATLTGAFAAVTITNPISIYIRLIPFLAPYSQIIAFCLVVIIITCLSLIAGELMPKRLALNNPEGIAAFMAIPMKGVTTLALPLVSFLNACTDVIVQGLGMTHRPSQLICMVPLFTRKCLSPP